MLLSIYAELMEQLLREDGIAVLAEGLGLMKLLGAMVRLQSEQQGGLVLVLGAPSFLCLVSRSI